MTNVVAVVLAHNECEALPRTLSILSRFKEIGQISSIIVVNDGSTDNTARIAKEMGVVVVTHKKALGKRIGFVSGALKAKEMGAEVMLSLDADIHFFPLQTLKDMVREVTVGKKLMAVAKQYEELPSQRRKFGGVHFVRNKNVQVNVQKGNKFINIINTNSVNPYQIVETMSSNAQRAINMNGLNPLFAKNSKWRKYFYSKRLPSLKELFASEKDFLKKRVQKKSKLWGLELALDILIPKSKIVILDSPILTREAFSRGKGVSFAQKLSKLRLIRITELRSAKAKKLRAQRRFRTFAKRKL
ncbi:MAG: glycosyltransferase family 2 protein [Candidatus Diapherotrites archaeon]|nr:glycosyltransferase family 2 protein [Candidatus Diapherotrites archaeon]